MTKFKPCPFCGCRVPPAVQGNGIGDNWLECTECGASTRLREDGAGSEKDWNRRAARATAEQRDSVPIAWMVTNVFYGSVSFHTEEAEARAFKGRQYKVEPLYSVESQQDAAIESKPAEQSDPIRALIAVHAEQLDQNDYAYFELAYTRQTAWMAWLCSNSRDDDPNRKVLAKGQGHTPEEACAAAIESQRSGDGS